MIGPFSPYPCLTPWPTSSFGSPAMGIENKTFSWCSFLALVSKTEIQNVILVFLLSALNWCKKETSACVDWIDKQLTFFYISHFIRQILSVMIHFLLKQRCSMKKSLSSILLQIHMLWYCVQTQFPHWWSKWGSGVDTGPFLAFHFPPTHPMLYAQKAGTLHQTLKLSQNASCIKP